MLIETLTAAAILLSPFTGPRDERDLTPLPAPPANRIVAPELGLDVAFVGDYTDCSRATEVSHAGAQRDGCLPGHEHYFIGHNPGPFTPLMNAQPGTRITYYDAGGLPHDYRIVSVREWNASWGAPPYTEADVVAQFQTCITLDGTWDRILDATPV